MARREDIYIQQLKALGIWEEAFAPEVSTLAQLERDLTRAKKAWSATVPKGGKPSLLDPLYGVICNLRREILTHRESLGLTPKALRRLRGVTGEGPDQRDLITERLDLIADRVGGYDAGDAQSEAAAIVQEWDELGKVLNLNTDEE